MAERGAQAADLPPSVLHGLAAELVAVCVDLQQYNLTYYFHDGHETSLAAALPAALTLGDEAVSESDRERRLAGAALRSALEDLTALLDRQYLRTGGTPRRSSPPTDTTRAEVSLFSSSGFEPRSGSILDQRLRGRSTSKAGPRPPSS